MCSFGIYPLPPPPAEAAWRRSVRQRRRRRINPQSLPTPSLPHMISQTVPNFLPRCDFPNHCLPACWCHRVIPTLAQLLELFWASRIPCMQGKLWCASSVAPQEQHSLSGIFPTNQSIFNSLSYSEHQMGLSGQIPLLISETFLGAILILCCTQFGWAFLMQFPSQIL